MGRVGLAVGLTAAAAHLLGIILLLTARERLVNAGLAWHFLSVPGIALNPFNAVQLVLGLVAAFVSGLVMGAIFALIWNAIAAR